MSWYVVMPDYGWEPSAASYKQYYWDGARFGNEVMPSLAYFSLEEILTKIDEAKSDGSGLCDGSEEGDINFSILELRMFLQIKYGVFTPVRFT